MNEISVDFIDGFINGLSESCHGADYVPFYGAESFELDEDKNIPNSLRKHLGVSVGNYSRVDNYSFLKNKNWKEVLNKLLVKWIDKKYLNGKAVKLGYDFESFSEGYKDSIETQIEDLVGSSPDCFTVELGHEKYGTETEAIGFVEKDISFYIYFGWSD